MNAQTCELLTGSIYLTTHYLVFLAGAVGRIFYEVGGSVEMLLCVSCVHIIKNV